MYPYLKTYIPIERFPFAGEILHPTCLGTFITWVNDSCYFDSALVALFFEVSTWWDNALRAELKDTYWDVKLQKQKIQRLIRLTGEHLRSRTCGSTTTSTILRQELELFEELHNDRYPEKKVTPKNWWHTNRSADNKSSQQEPSDFLNVVYSILKPAENLHLKKKITYSPPVETLYQDVHTTPTYLIPVAEYEDPFTAVQADGILSYSGLRLTEGKKFREGKFYREEIQWIHDTQFLHLHLKRNFFDGAGKRKKFTHRVSLTPLLSLPSGKKLSLKSFIVHHGGSWGGHYVAYIQLSNGWYLYNDQQTKYAYVGRVQHFVTDYIRANITDLFYF